MERWALVSGLNGDLETYEQIQRHLKLQRGVSNLFILGDIVGANPKCNALLERIRHPQRNDIAPDCIYGWLEDELLAELGFRGDRRAELLRQSKGEDAVLNLASSVDQSHISWLASLQFGFIELDCALIHGSSADVGDQLDDKTSPLILLDRLTRLDVNRLFTARSQKQFTIELTGGGVHSKVVDHAAEHESDQAVPKRTIIGIGSGYKYTIYDPATDKVEFLDAKDKVNTAGRGFA